MPLALRFKGVSYRHDAEHGIRWRAFGNRTRGELRGAAGAAAGGLRRLRRRARPRAGGGRHPTLPAHAQRAVRGCVQVRAAAHARPHGTSLTSYPQSVFSRVLCYAASPTQASGDPMSQARFHAATTLRQAFLRADAANLSPADMRTVTGYVSRPLQRALWTRTSSPSPG